MIQVTQHSHKSHKVPPRSLFIQFYKVSDPTGSHNLLLDREQPLNCNMAYRHSDNYSLTIPWPTASIDGYH